MIKYISDDAANKKKAKKLFGCILTLPHLLISDLGDSIWTFYINQTYEKGRYSMLKCSLTEKKVPFYFVIH